METTEDAPMHVLVPPIHSTDGNVGIEQDAEFIGAYTECCQGDPTYDDGWKCFYCRESLHVFHSSRHAITLDLRKSSSEDVADWVASWLNRPTGDIKVEISLP